VGATSADLVIVGAGLSGTLTALRLAGSEWIRDHRVLLVDRETDPLARRAWGYWSTDPVVPGADECQWARLLLHDRRRTVEVHLHEYRYRRLGGELLAGVLRRTMATPPTVMPVTATVVAVDDPDPAGAPVVRFSDGSRVTAGHVLDSTRSLLAPPTSATLSFVGSSAGSAEHPVPGSGAVTLMDLRIPQQDAVRFVYVIPGADGRGLVELTSFNPRGGASEGLERDLHDWIATRIGPAAADAARPVERSTYPLVHRGNRRVAPHTLLMGRRAGVLGAATGYGVIPIDADARAVAASLTARGHPFATPGTMIRRRWLDDVFLEVMARDPAAIRRTYMDIFQRNDGDDVLRFLNGDADATTTAALIATMPKTPFLTAAMAVPPPLR
jgi:lycopene beta-cyclase